MAQKAGVNPKCGHEDCGRDLMPFQHAVIVDLDSREEQVVEVRELRKLEHRGVMYGVEHGTKIIVHSDIEGYACLDRWKGQQRFAPISQPQPASAAPLGA